MGRRVEYRRYSAEFKLTAVKLSYQKDVLSKDVAEALDIHPLMLSRWRKHWREGKIKDSEEISIKLDAKQVAELRRLRKLERKHQLLKEEHALLKKAIQFSLEQKRKSTNS